MKKNTRTTNDEGLSLKSCVCPSHKSRMASEIRRDMGTGGNDEKFWKSRTPLLWVVIATFLVLLTSFAIWHYAPEFYERYELAFDICTGGSISFFVGYRLWCWWRRAPRRRYEVAVGACAILGVSWIVLPCFNLLRRTDDPTQQYQLLSFAGVSLVLMIVFHYLWRRVRNRSTAEMQNLRAKARATT